MWLILDNSDNMFLAPYAKRYMLFSNHKSAKKLAIARGYRSPFCKVDFSTMKEGAMAMYKCGEVDISVLRLAIQDKSNGK